MKIFVGVLVIILLGWIGLAIYVLVSVASTNAKDPVAVVEAVEVEVPPLSSLLRVTVDHANGFVCYDNMASIACQPLWYGIPPPDAMGYIQSNIGRVFAVPPMPLIPSPTPPALLNGMN